MALRYSDTHIHINTLFLPGSNRKQVSRSTSFSLLTGDLLFLSNKIIARAKRRNRIRTRVKLQHLPETGACACGPSIDFWKKASLEAMPINRRDCCPGNLVCQKCWYVRDQEIISSRMKQLPQFLIFSNKKKNEKKPLVDFRT